MTANVDSSAKTPPVDSDAAQQFAMALEALLKKGVSTNDIQKMLTEQAALNQRTNSPNQDGQKTALVETTQKDGPPKSGRATTPALAQMAAVPNHDSTKEPRQSVLSRLLMHPDTQDRITAAKQLAIAAKDANLLVYLPAGGAIDLATKAIATVTTAALPANHTQNASSSRR